MSSIRTEQHAGWRKIILNRPDRLNAFNEDMHVNLKQALDTAAADPACRAILITGEGRGFCAGQDLTDQAAGGAEPVDLGRTVEQFYNPLVRLLRSLPKPIICAVNGVAAGAGANIALACDIVLAARSAKFVQAFAKIGLVPELGRNLLPATSGWRGARTGAGTDRGAAYGRAGGRMGVDLESGGRRQFAR